MTPGTVTKWRAALGVPEYNPGTRRLREAGADHLHTPSTDAKRAATCNRPAHRRAIVARLTGAKRPAEVGAKISAALAGRTYSREWAANVRAGLRWAARRYPRNGRPCSPAEDDVIGRVPAAAAARQVGRSPRAIRIRLRALRR